MKKLYGFIFIIIMFFSILTQVSALSIEDIDFTNDNLAIGTFFSSKYDSNGKSVPDDRIGLYVTTNGEDFVYIGETGTTGRDPRIIYINGVFYMIATKGGSSAGGFTFNLFKSTDLINWTHDTEYPFDYRYDVDVVENNIYGLPANNWGPKWFKEDDKLYIAITTTRFDKDGARYSFVKGNTIDDYADKGINPNKGVLIKEYAELNDDDKAQYISTDGTVYYLRDNKKNIYNLNGVKLVEDNGVYTDNENNCILDTKSNNKLSCNNTAITLKIKTTKELVYLDGNVVQADCPWYDGGYALFDRYISEVELGSTEQQMDINYQNLTFKGFHKIDLKGYNFDKEDEINSKDKKYFLQHSTLFNLIKRNNDGSQYKYTMYLKTDPFGTVQRWVSNSIDGEWFQMDERYYPIGYVSEDNSYYATDNENNDDNTCKTLVKLSSWEGRLASSLVCVMNSDGSACSANRTLLNQDKFAFDKHFEGAEINNFGNDVYFYSDHYNATEVGSGATAEEKLKYAGIYYSVLQPNNGDNVDFSVINDHIRFNAFHQVNTENTSMRPSDIQDNVVRNGGVYRPTNSSDMAKFKSIVASAAEFHLTPKIYSTNNNDKLIVVVKSNRALKDSENDDWQFASKMPNDVLAKSLNKDLAYSFKKYDSTIPYTDNELYLYKIVDKASLVKLTVKDQNDEEKTTSFCAIEEISDEEYNKFKNGEQEITYEYFGAKGDGKTDDFCAIKAAHDLANKIYVEENVSLTVYGTENKTYYIGSNPYEVISIYTSTDWRGANFILDDFIEKYGIVKTLLPIFNISSPFETTNSDKLPYVEYTSGNVLNDFSNFNTSTTKLPNIVGHVMFSENLTADQRKYLNDATKWGIQLTCSSKKVYIRTGSAATSGDYMRENIVIDKSGNILSPITWDYDAGCIDSVKIWPIPNDSITVQNGNFTTYTDNIVNYKNSQTNICEIRAMKWRNIVVGYTGNVNLDNITHYIDETAHPRGSTPCQNEQSANLYRGFIYLDNASNINLNNLKLSAHTVAHKVDDDGTVLDSFAGTYDIQIYNSINVLMNQVSYACPDGIDDSVCYYSNIILNSDDEDSPKWGIFGTYESKNIYINDSKLNRMDAHRGVQNLSIINSTIGTEGLRLIGKGYFYGNNIIFDNTDSVISLREDYGSTWDGDVLITDSELIYSQNNLSTNLVFSANDETHNFGYMSYFPNIYINNFKVNMEKQTNNSNLYLLRLNENISAPNDSNNYYYFKDNAYFNNLSFINHNNNINTYLFSNGFANRDANMNINNYGGMIFYE